MKLHDIRKEYKKGSLNKHNVLPNPMEQFNAWMDEAVNHCKMEPTAMTLSTVNAEGQPDARVVLLKDMQEEGFIFYTNYNSQKGQELASNPKAAISFFWPEMERQVRILGHVSKVSQELSEVYFKSRPRGSQIGAVISNQSSEVESREVLTKRFKELNGNEDNIEKPAHWGGYILKPSKLEFWQGGEYRIHDRIQYELKEGDWKIVRLAP